MEEKWLKAKLFYTPNASSQLSTLVGKGARAKMLRDWQHNRNRCCCFSNVKDLSFHTSLRLKRITILTSTDKNILGCMKSIAVSDLQVAYLVLFLLNLLSHVVKNKSFRTRVWKQHRLRLLVKRKDHVHSHSSLLESMYEWDEVFSILKCRNAEPVLFL